jgi:mono/diheme cytochrome c family protein
MKKLTILATAVGFSIVTLLVAQNRPGATAAKAVPAGDTAKYRAMVNQYCSGCHSGTAAQPAENPVKLDVNLDNLLDNADTWERVLRKLIARVPPPGMPRPPEAGTQR